MNEGSNQQQPRNPGHRKQRRRRKNFSNQPGGQQNQGGRPQQGSGGNGGNGGGGQHRQNRNRGGQQRRSNAFVGPMDHSYRNVNGSAQNQQNRFRNGAAPVDNLEPLQQREDAPTRIYAFIDDLFFVAKINEVSRKLNVKVEFVKSEKEIAEKVAGNGDEKPSLVIVDLNANSVKPLSIISKLRSKYKRATSIVGFVSHVQGDLKVKAQEAGCDVVMPRSAFSQTLPNILRRHGAEDEAEENYNKA